MTKRFMRWLPALWIGVALILGSCAALTSHDPLRVTVAGIESLPGEGLEARMLVKLRVQNPNDAAIEYNGGAVRLSLQDTTIASGVTGEQGVLPRYGEVVVGIPVTLSMVSIAVQMMKLFHDKAPPESVRYVLEGKLETGFGAMRFRTEAQLKVPGVVVQ